MLNWSPNLLFDLFNFQLPEKSAALTAKAIATKNAANKMIDFFINDVFEVYSIKLGKKHKSQQIIPINLKKYFG